MVQANNIDFRVIDLLHANNDHATELDEMLKSAISQSAVATYADKQRVIEKMSGPSSVISPEELLDIQQRTSDYNLQVSLISTLARKAVGAVETVLRA